MKNIHLTAFSKFLIFILLIGILCGISYLLICIYYVTDTNKLIINNTLILKNGLYFSFDKNIINLKNFPTAYDPLLLPDKLNQDKHVYITKDIPLELQLSDGTIYKCNFFIASTFDSEWVIKNKIAPVITIPEYTLNSYVLDHVGKFSRQDLFKAETKHELELLIKNWLINNTKNHGIIIKDVKINTVFNPVINK